MEFVFPTGAFCFHLSAPWLPLLVYKGAGGGERVMALGADHPLPARRLWEHCLSEHQFLGLQVKTITAPSWGCRELLQSL